MRDIRYILYKAGIYVCISTAIVKSRPKTRVTLVLGEGLVKWDTKIVERLTVHRDLQTEIFFSQYLMTKSTIKTA